MAKILLQLNFKKIGITTTGRLKDGKKTGGGSAVKLYDNDKLTWKILGCTNPKVTMVPGAIANTSTCSLPSTISEDENEHEMKSPVMKKSSET